MIVFILNKPSKTDTMEDIAGQFLCTHFKMSLFLLQEVQKRVPGNLSEQPVLAVEHYYIQQNLGCGNHLQ